MVWRIPLWRTGRRWRDQWHGRRQAAGGSSTILVPLPHSRLDAEQDCLSAIAFALEGNPADMTLPLKLSRST